MGGILKVGALALAIILALVGAFVGGRYSVDALAAEGGDGGEDQASAATWEVTELEIGRTLDATAEVSVATVPGPAVQRTGIITALPGGVELAPNAVVIEIDLKPVVIGWGEVPAFRALQWGTSGRDVDQLRAFLCELGHLAECSDGTAFGRPMRDAVVAWQKTLGAPQTGVVEAGDIMWLSEPPLAMIRATGVEVGGSVSPDTRPFDVVTGTPEVVLAVTAEQAALFPPGSLVSVEGLADGVLAEPRLKEVTAGAGGAQEAGAEIPVLAADGGAWCTAGDACTGWLDGAATAKVAVLVGVVPSMSGPAVPLSAVMSDAAGATYVTSDTGARVDVTILGSSGGVAVVDGLATGDLVRVADAEQ